MPDSGLERVDAVVVGGGVAGLTAAFELTRRGLRPVVVEAGAELGGVVGRHEVAGVVLDSATESYAVGRPAVSTLIDDLGIADLVETPAAAGAWVQHQRGAAPLPPGGWLGVPSVPWSSAVRRVVGTLGAARAALTDRLIAPGAGITDGTTLGALVRLRMGSAVAERLVEPVVGGVHAADPDDLELVSIAPGLPDALARTGSLAAAALDLRGAAGPSGSAVAGLRGGMFELVLALERAILAAGGRIRRSTEVAPRPIPGGGWRIGDLVTQRLVLAVDGAGAQRLLPTIVPGLATGTVADIGATGADIGLVTLVLDAPELDRAPRGTGVLVASRAAGIEAKALTHATAKWRSLAAGLPAGRHVVRLSYGRSGRPVPVDADIVDRAVVDAAVLLGVPVLDSDRLIGAAVVRRTGALPAQRLGHAAAVSAVRTAARSVDGLVVVGGYLAGTGLAAVVGDTRDALRALP